MRHSYSLMRGLMYYMGSEGRRLPDGFTIIWDNGSTWTREGVDKVVLSREIAWDLHGRWLRGGQLGPDVQIDAEEGAHQSCT